MTARTAPTLQRLAASEWNFYGAAEENLTGREYREAEDAAWRACSRELRALLAVARAAEYEGWGADHHEIRSQGACRLCKAIRRLQRASRAPRVSGKRRR